MNKAKLMKLVADMPDDAPIFLDVEGGVDFARSVSLVPVRKTVIDWSNTPVGNFRIVSDEEDEATTGEPFQAILISLDGPP